MATQPVVLIVHGAWHQPAHYEKLTSAFNSAGFQVAIPHLPTCTNVVPPPTTFDDDCQTVRSVTTALADDGHQIIVVMHSYGGVVGTNSLQGLSYTARSAQGQKGGVIRLIYVCSFLLPLNGSLCTPFGGKFPPFMDEQVEQGTCTMQNPEWRFYDEVTDEEERRHYLGLMTGHPAAAQRSTIRYVAYRDIPVTYLVCKKDNALVEEGQRGMIKTAEGEIVKHGEGEDVLETGGVFGGKVHVVSSMAGHSPFASRPGDIVACVQQVAKIYNGV